MKLTQILFIIISAIFGLISCKQKSESIKAKTEKPKESKDAINNNCVELSLFQGFPPIKKLSDLQIKKATLDCNLLAGEKHAICLPMVTDVELASKDTIADKYIVSLCEQNQNCLAKESSSGFEMFYKIMRPTHTAKVQACVEGPRSPKPKGVASNVTFKGQPLWCFDEVPATPIPGIQIPSVQNPELERILSRIDEIDDKNENGAKLLYRELGANLTSCKFAQGRTVCTKPADIVMMSFLNYGSQFFTDKIISDMENPPNLNELFGPAPQQGAQLSLTETPTQDGSILCQAGQAYPDENQVEDPPPAPPATRTFATPGARVPPDMSCKNLSQTTLLANGSWEGEIAQDGGVITGVCNQGYEGGGEIRCTAGQWGGHDRCLHCRKQ